MNTSYDSNLANEYDSRSGYDKGDREKHKRLLLNTLEYCNFESLHLLDVGCGTGYFSAAVLEQFPRARITLIDGSAPMLKIARQRLHANQLQCQFLEGNCEDLNWQSCELSHFVICSLLLHFLSPRLRVPFLRSIFQNLETSGRLFLVLQHEPDEQVFAEYMEYLYCKELQYQFQKELEIDFELDELKIDNLIANDRKKKIEQGEKAVSVEQYLTELQEAGFQYRDLLFYDSRYAIILATKGDD